MKSLNQRRELPVTGRHDRPMRLNVEDYIQPLTDWHFFCEFLAKEKKWWHRSPSSLSFPFLSPFLALFITIKGLSQIWVFISSCLICRGNNTYCSLKDNCRVNPGRTVCITSQGCFTKCKNPSIEFKGHWLFFLPVSCFTLLSLTVLFSAGKNSSDHFNAGIQYLN